MDFLIAELSYIEFFDVKEHKEMGKDNTTRFIKVTLENGGILNIVGTWYNDNTIIISGIYQFEVLGVEEQNRFFDSRKSQNGGGYRQPLITFAFNGVAGYINDSSCGDFGKRIHVQYKDKSYSLNTIGEYEEESSFSKKCSEDRLLAEHLKETGYTIRFQEDYELWKLNYEKTL